MLNRESNYIIAREKKIVLWEGMSLLAMNSLYEKNGQYDGYLWSKHKRLTPCATRTIIFQRQFKLFNSLYHSVYLVFSTLVFYCQYVQPCVICGKECNKTSQQVTTDRMSNKNHVLAKQNRYSRQSRWFDG